MDAVGRFKHFRRKFRKKIGGPITRRVDRHLSLAASIELALENTRHEMFLGRKFDPAVLAGLREQLGIALMRATIATQARKATS
jgi:hypothetical protein